MISTTMIVIIVIIAIMIIMIIVIINIIVMLTANSKGASRPRDSRRQDLTKAFALATETSYNINIK